MKRLIATLLLIAAGSVSAYDGPIIDMHVHAWPSGEDGGPEKPKNKKTMQAERAALKKHNVVLAAVSGPQDFLEVWANDSPDELLLGPIFPCIDGKNPVYYRHDCFNNGENFPNIEWLEAQYMAGNYGVMGELYNQYAGIPFDDPRMDPYYEMAERLSIPVAFHTHAAPPLTAQQCCPSFRLSNGNPLLLENVLVKHPKLRVQIMHANPLVYPEVFDLLVQFPKVYVDVSPWQMAYTRKKFHQLLKAYADAGMIGRIMFGSDGADYDKAIPAYTSAEFLTGKQLSGIFCKNAERFLRKAGTCGAVIQK
ncbi:MAG: amidohydrolase family protein [Gammaproteobacteria bacterium]|nr:amidohydrolase family protein [Gammaproteobacteria bacterium]